MSDIAFTITPPTDTTPAGAGVLLASNGAGTQAGAVVLPSTAQKYATALIHFVNVAVTPLAVLLVGTFTWVALWQYVALVLGAVGSYLVPLAPVKWQGVGKTLVAVAGAIIAALIPTLTDTWTSGTVMVLVMAAVGALGTELGVQIRTDTKTSTTINAA